MTAVFVVARTARQRPTLMHVLHLPSTMTPCGVETKWWSRAYFNESIPQIMCLKCGRQRAVTLEATAERRRA